MRRSALLVALVIALVGCGVGAPPRSSAPRRVSLMLDWTPNPDHVGLFVAQRELYLSRAGLAVTVRSPADPTTPLKLLAAGRTDLAISYEPELFFAAAKHLPVVAVASVVPEPLDSVISLRPLPSIRALRGRSIGITGVPTDDAFLDTMLAHVGLARGDVRVVHVGYDLLPALVSHRVDAILGGYRNVEGIQLAQRGLRPSILPVDRAGVPTYDELVVAANSDRLVHDAAYAREVRDFVGALAAGDRTARDDPAVALDAVSRRTQSTHAFLVRSVPATTALLRDAPCLDETSWAAFGAWMVRRRLLARAVPASSVATTKYLPARCR